MTLPSKNDILIELSKRKFEHYVQYANGSSFIHGKFTRYLCKTVQDFIETDTGNAYDILLLSVAPQHGKSETITRTLPSWLLGRFPKEQSMLIAYESTFAEEFLEHNRRKLKDNNIFGLNITRDISEKVETDQGGAIRAMGFKSGITGRTAKYVIIDDPIKNQEQADSKVIRDKIWKEFNSSVRSRLKPSAKIIIIMTRWHKEDLAGMIMANEPNTTVINFPVECETDTDIMGRVYGEMLCPEMGRTRAWWDSFKLGYQNEFGSRSVLALYYGRPSNEAGGIFQRKWFENNYYTDRPKFAYMAISLDATFKGNEDSDFVAIQVWVKLGQHYYLLYRFKQRMGFSDTLKKMLEVVRMFGLYNVILVEDKANGSAIIEMLRKSCRSVVEIEPYGNKISRANAISPIVESGCVHIKPDHSELIEEAVDFPNSDHDDEVDCMSQAINYMKNIVAELPVPKDTDYRSYDDEINAILDYQG